MRQIQQYLLDASQAESFRINAHPREHTLLSVERGVMWVTVDGDAADHWLRAGDTFEVRGSRRLFLSAEGGPVHFETVSVPISARVAAGQSARHYFQQNAARRLSPGARSGRLPGLT